MGGGGGVQKVRKMCHEVFEWPLTCFSNGKDIFLKFYLVKFKKTFAVLQTERGSVGQISLDRNCHFTLDQNFCFHKIKLFESFH
jgi:hypothetical protein